MVLYVVNSFMTSSARSWFFKATISVKREATKRVRPDRDFEVLKERRLHAGAMFERDVTQADVERELRVSRESVSTWATTWRESGTDGLLGVGSAGCLPKISDQQLVKI